MQVADISAARLIVAVCCAGLMAGCASSAALRNGHAAERADDFDRAVVEYTRAVREHPDNKDAQLSLERARLRAAELHFSRGRRLAATGKLDDALLELQIAAELNPASGEVDSELRRARTALRNRVPVSEDGRTRLETLVEKSRDFQPSGLELPHDTKLPESLVFRDASARDVLTSIARFANVNVLFDPAFRDAPITIELRATTLEDALASITGSTRNFYKVTAARSVTIVPDTPAKRREYEDEVVRTFYLSNAELKETIDLLRIVVDLRRLAGLPGTNAITIKDTPERLAAASKIIAAIDKARPEVVIDVQLLEVDRRRFREYGLQIASPNPTGPTGIDGAADVNREGLTLESLRRLGQADVFVTGVPALYYRLLKSDTNTRTLASPQLRTSEGITAQAKFGERVPVPVTTFAPIATGGVPQQPVTSFNYENIGVNIDITPRTHHNDEISLVLKVEVSSVSGVGFGGLPTFGSRFISTVIRLKDGETNMLAGLIRDDERRVLEGIPGLSDIPVVGRLFSRNRKETQETDIVLTLTPHIVRVLDLTDSDLRPFRLGRESGSPLIELPTAPPPVRQDEEAPPQPQLPPAQRPAEPILPPQPNPPQPNPPAPPQ